MFIGLAIDNPHYIEVYSKLSSFDLFKFIHDILINGWDPVVIYEKRTEILVSYVQDLCSRSKTNSHRILKTDNGIIVNCQASVTDLILFLFKNYVSSIHTYSACSKGHPERRTCNTVIAYDSWDIFNENQSFTQLIAQDAEERYVNCGTEIEHDVFCEGIRTLRLSSLGKI